jgi:Bacterial Ig domain
MSERGRSRSTRPTTRVPGISTFVQALYRVAGPGVWSLDRRVPLAAIGEFRPPSDDQFPLTAFTLNRFTGGGSLGAVLATSPKRDYCITGDTMLIGVPHTPDQTFISPSNCDDPTRPLGWSVGWGDEYDQTDAGQPISLRGVPNGTYVLHAVVDPRHVFIESDAANDVTDTTLRIAGDSVTVLGQRNPRVIPPRATVTFPRAGAGVSGAVTLEASASASPPAVVRSVQFLLDGRPLGRPVEHAPFRKQWMTGAGAPGTHRLSAEVTDSSGNLGTARPVRVIVRPAPPLTVRRVRWRRGILTLAVAGVPGARSCASVSGSGTGRRGPLTSVAGVLPSTPRGRAPSC